MKTRIQQSSPFVALFSVFRPLGFGFFAFCFLGIVPPAKADDVIATVVAAGYGHSLYVAGDGSLYATGWNGSG